METFNYLISYNYHNVPCVQGIELNNYLDNYKLLFWVCFLIYIRSSIVFRLLTKYYSVDIELLLYKHYLITKICIEHILCARQCGKYTTNNSCKKSFPGICRASNLTINRDDVTFRLTFLPYKTHSHISFTKIRVRLISQISL